jgi:hypothetical protein
VSLLWPRRGNYSMRARRRLFWSWRPPPVGRWARWCASRSSRS